MLSIKKNIHRRIIYYSAHDCVSIAFIKMKNFNFLHVQMLIKKQKIEM